MSFQGKFTVASLSKKLTLEDRALKMFGEGDADRLSSCSLRIQSLN